MIELVEAQQFLVDKFGDQLGGDVLVLGEGAWSRCFGFEVDGAALVVRFGEHVSDFEKDRLAYERYHAAELPIPQMLEIGEAFEGYYAISRRAYGVPLESVGAEEWLVLLPSLVAALEGLRTAELPAGVGGGGWDGEGQASHESWMAYLLDVGADAATGRLKSWWEPLTKSPTGEKTYLWGAELLSEVAVEPERLSLLHGDLINRNVFVQDGRVSAVFDWGCGLYGDHLYELAWFEFWAPWYPELDISVLREALFQRWEASGYRPVQAHKRLQAAYVRIGLDHLAYNASLGDFEALEATAERMRVLVEGR